MISFNFDYYKPESINEAVKGFIHLDSIGKSPLYYNGGTEIITFARTNSIYTAGVVDIKGIPECNVLELRQSYLIIGSSVTLNEISDSKYYPLLGRVSSEIADHTARNSITLGGNICGKIQYREAVMPLLLADSFLVIAGADGVKTYPIKDVFIGIPRLSKGEFIVQILIPAENINLSSTNIKRRKASTIGYPIVSIAALGKDEKIRLALSGVSDFPFRDLKMEEEINKLGLPVEKRAENAINAIPYPIKDNLFGSSEFRKHLLKNDLMNIINILESGNEDL